MSLKEKPKNFDHKKLEKKIYNEWLEKDLFSAKPNSKKSRFSIMMPPPNVTGTLHIGHALNMTIQDILARYWRMQGKDVLWQPGTDHAGIATQNVVERYLKKDKKVNIKNITKDQFLSEVWEWKSKSGEQIINQIKRLGASPDWKRMRFTMDKDMSESVNNAFISLYKDGLIYKDKRLVNWDTKLQTAISDLEVEQKEKEGEFVYIKYFLKNNADFLEVATTRPETIFGDTGIAVHPDDKRYKKFIGSSVKIPLTNTLIPVIADDYVDKSKGSGVLKITPAHDFNDYVIGKKHNMQFKIIFDKKGKFNENVPEKYRGLDRVESRKEIISALKKNNFLTKIKKINHTIPYGDRSGTIVEPYLTDQWFLDVKPLANKAISFVQNKKTKFYPNNWANVFFSWMKEIEPWCISRQIIWGHQLPVWYGPDKKIFVAKNEKEALKLANSFYKEKVFLNQETDVLDTWFSSALWPMATLGWPKNNFFLRKYFPTDVLVTGFDIIFFWVARMIMQASHFKNISPFKAVYIHALVRDKKGQKMSKSKGNVIDPLELINFYGADPLRYTLTSLAVQGRDIKLSEADVKNSRNFLTKIWNSFKFLEENKCLKKSCKYNLNLKLSINVWLVSSFNDFVKSVDKNINNFRFNDVAKEIYKFTKNIFCDWYLEFIKIDFRNKNKKDLKEIKDCANFVSHQILKITHPIMPFVTDDIYINQIRNKKYLIEEKWPKPIKLSGAKSKKDEIDLLKDLISKIRKSRAEFNLNSWKPIDLFITKKTPSIKIIFPKYRKHIEFLCKVKIQENKKDEINTKKYYKFLFKNSTFFIEKSNKENESKKDIKDSNFLKKELKKINDEIIRLRTKLENKNFIDKAPATIILETRKKLDKNIIDSKSVKAELLSLNNRE